MFYTNTILLNPDSVTELTAAIDVDQRFVFTVRIPSGDVANGAVRVGTSGVSSSNGFSLDSGGQEVTFTLEGDKVYATPVSSSNSTYVDVLAYSA